MASRRRAVQPPARHRIGNAGGRGNAQGQPLHTSHREIGEGLRFDVIAVPAGLLGGHHPALQARAQLAHQRRVVPPAAADNPGKRRARQMFDAARNRGRGERGERRCAVRGRQSLHIGHGKIEIDRAILAASVGRSDGRASWQALAHSLVRCARVYRRGRSPRQCA